MISPAQQKQALWYKTKAAVLLHPCATEDQKAAYIYSLRGPYAADEGLEDYQQRIINYTLNFEGTKNRAEKVAFLKGLGLEVSNKQRYTITVEVEANEEWETDTAKRRILQNRPGLEGGIVPDTVKILDVQITERL